MLQLQTRPRPAIRVRFALRRAAPFSLCAAFLALFASCEALGFNKPVELPPPPVHGLPTGVTWVDLEVGAGEQVVVGDLVRVHYTASTDGGPVFDSTVERATPVEFVVGDREVIPGFDDGIVGMRPGGRRRLRIPADQAYGSEGLEGSVPPDSTLVLVIEIVAIL